MNEELRAAALDITGHWERGNGDGPVRQLANNAIALADAWLEEHPADDGEPVTVEWMLSVGFHWESARKERLLAPIADVMLWMTKSGCWRVKDEGGDAATVSRKLPARADVRALCKALGITLKGGEA